jgi:hypothetical protein
MVDRKVPDTYLIEAEDVFQGSGWSTSSEFVGGFSDNGFLYDNWNAATIHYNLPLLREGQYRIWIRSYKRLQNDQVNFITIAGKKTEFASNSNTLNAWVWDDLGTYSLSNGSLPIFLSRTYGNDPEYSVFIDSILITPDLFDPPDQVQIWNNFLNTGDIPSASTQYSFAEALPPGEYRWKVRIFDGNRLIASTGEIGVESKIAIFNINPE